MAWVSISTARNAMDAPISQDWGNDVVNDLNYLYGQSSNTTDASGAPIVPNGSFEQDANNSTSVTGWTVALGTGATGIVTNSDQNHGAQSFKFTRDTTVGHNGGSLTSSYLNVSPSLAYDIGFMLKCSRADVENTVQVAWFTATKSPISTTTIYDDGAGSVAPTTWSTVLKKNIVPPATAAYAQIILNGGIAALTPAATASILFDGVYLARRQAPSQQTVYTATTTNTFTVPSGVFLVRVRIYGKAQSGGVNFGGYCEGVLNVKPGDTVACTLDSSFSGANTVVYGSTTFRADNYASSTAPSGGSVNMTKASTFTTQQIVLDY